MRKSVIQSCGSYLPERVMTNDELAKLVDTSNEWILERTGIHQRHIVSAQESTTQLAEAAARQAIESAGISPESIDLIVVGTTTPDRIYPSTACRLQARLLNGVPDHLYAQSGDVGAGRRVDGGDGGGQTAIGHGPGVEPGGMPRSHLHNPGRRRLAHRDIGGGGVKRRYVYGKSDAQGAYPDERPVRPEDLAATIYYLLGIDPQSEIRDRADRPLTIGGKPVLDIVA